jgi:hypothetical protein
VPRFNARSNFLLVDEGFDNKKFWLISFRKSRDITLDLRERVVNVMIVFAATTDRIAFAQRSGVIVICEFDGRMLASSELCETMLQYLQDRK